MTFNELAKMVADEFKETMIDEGFNTFNEMCRCYEWDAQDIKEEVNFILNEISSKLWKEKKETVWMSDDFSFIQLNLNDMSWREFKKLIFQNLI